MIILVLVFMYVHNKCIASSVVKEKTTSLLQASPPPQRPSAQRPTGQTPLVGRLVLAHYADSAVPYRTVPYKLLAARAVRPSEPRERTR